VLLHLLANVFCFAETGFALERAAAFYQLVDDFAASELRAALHSADILLVQPEWTLWTQQHQQQHQQQQQQATSAAAQADPAANSWSVSQRHTAVTSRSRDLLSHSSCSLGFTSASSSTSAVSSTSSMSSKPGAGGEDRERTPCALHEMIVTLWPWWRSWVHVPAAAADNDDDDGGDEESIVKIMNIKWWWRWWWREHCKNDEYQKMMMAQIVISLHRKSHATHASHHACHDSTLPPLPLTTSNLLPQRLPMKAVSLTRMRYLHDYQTQPGE
jgi:hypothetical protein